VEATDSPSSRLSMQQGELLSKREVLEQKIPPRLKRERGARVLQRGPAFHHRLGPLDQRLDLGLGRASLGQPGHPAPDVAEYLTRRSCREEGHRENDAANGAGAKPLADDDGSAGGDPLVRLARGLSRPVCRAR
jgi:hypothetical protein